MFENFNVNFVVEVDFFFFSLIYIICAYFPGGVGGGAHEAVFMPRQQVARPNFSEVQSRRSKLPSALSVNSVWCPSQRLLSNIPGKSKDVVASESESNATRFS